MNEEIVDAAGANAHWDATKEGSADVAAAKKLAETRARVHANCVACGDGDGRTPRVKFEPTSDGGVEAHVLAGAAFEGYSGMVHGGVIATLLDAAMTNCLFSRGECGVTGDLHIRYRLPVDSAHECRIRAWFERIVPPLFVLRSELMQDGKAKATAVGKFMAPEAARD